jgi:hypothetical protein
MTNRGGFILNHFLLYHTPLGIKFISLASHADELGNRHSAAGLEVIPAAAGLEPGALSHHAIGAEIKSNSLNSNF